MRQYQDVSLDFEVGAVREVLAEFPVTFAALYGSRARGGPSATSDVDLAVGFDDSLDSNERTRARLSLIERLSRALGTDNIDVVPLARMQESLRREVREDGVLLLGSDTELGPVAVQPRDHEERLAEFDELLTELEQVV